MVVLMRMPLFLLLAVVGSQSPAKVIDISAERFAFTPSEIRTTVGTRLEMRVTKRGKGKATVVFTPNAPGKYTFECSHTCGAGHSFMRGVIVVTK
jgi:cytochrome c oxidase subunit 2